MNSAKYRTLIWAGLLSVIVAGGAIGARWLAPRPSVNAQSGDSPKSSDYSFASYHKEPPKGPLPATILPVEFKGDPQTRACYRMAGEMKEVLYQLPCLCACDKLEGHKSLLDCFTSKHGQHCDVCKKEAAFAYRESRKGTSIEQIRQGVMQGAWQKVNLNDFAILGLDSVNQYSVNQSQRKQSAKAN